MACECGTEETITVVRRHNRALRTVNQKLRKNLAVSKAEADEIFLALCDTDKSAELAFEKLRTLAGLTCGPRDYDTIVAMAVEALKP